MPQPRFKGPPEHPFAYYHCVSRVVNRDFRFGPSERGRFLTYLQKYSGFTGVRLLSFCVLSNHFHLLLEVPKRPEVVPDEELLTALACLYPPLRVHELREELAALRAVGRVDRVEQIRNSYLKRMWDVSFFMKELKQRFTQWYNRKEERRGTLWEERFRSVLVGSGEALALVAMYVDMNPVRAGICDDPAGFEWSTYGRATRGDRFALAALERLKALSHDQLLDEPNSRTSSGQQPADPATSWYAKRLDGRIPLSTLDHARPRADILPPQTRDEIRSVLASNGRLAWPELGLVRNRYFTAGGFLGEPTFVEETFARHRDRFGPWRKTGSHPLRGIRLEKLAVLRDLQKDVLDGMNARELSRPRPIRRSC